MKNLLVTLLFCLSLSVGTVAGQDRFTADKVVAVVGNSAILYSEIYETARLIEEQRKKSNYTSDIDPMDEALENMLLQKLLFHQARLDSLSVSFAAIEQTVDEQVNELIKANGSTLAVEKALNKSMAEIKDDMRGKVEQMSLAQQMQQTIRSKTTIIPGEVDRFYRQANKDSLPVIPEQYRFAQITKLPTSTEDAKMRVREELLDMRKRILEGTRFDLLARMYSIDGSATRGGEMDPTPKEGFVAPFAEALSNLKIGQVSEVVETEFGFHLIELLEKDGNLYRCRHILLRPVFSTNELMETDNLLDSIVNEVRNGNITFEQAALEHSDDSYSKRNGGIVSNHEMLEMYGAFDPSLSSTKFLTEDLIPSDYNVLKNLKVGEISNAFQTQTIRGNVMSKAIKLLEIIPSHTADLKNDYLHIERLALSAKQNKEFGKWLEDKIASMYVRIDDEFKDTDFKNKGWIK